MTFLRYSLFLVLYPTGISGEIGCLWASLEYIKKHAIGEVRLPNTHNIAFSWHSVLWFVMVGVYPLGSYVLYNFMLSQRRKYLATAKPKSQ